MFSQLAAVAPPHHLSGPCVSSKGLKQHLAVAPRCQKHALLPPAPGTRLQEAQQLRSCVAAAATGSSQSNAAAPAAEPSNADEDVAVSTMDALLSVMDDGTSEPEEQAPATASSGREVPAAVLEAAAELSEGGSSYNPEDAMSAPLSRYASTVVPAAPELEALLSAAEASGGSVSLEQLQALFSFRLDDFQAQAVQVLLNGRSVVVCAPTGAGKTAIAEAAAAATLARGQRVIYTTPLKALSNQKLMETAARFGSSRCGLQTGDTSLNTDADIVIMTTEILRNIMYRTAEVVGLGKSGATRDERLGDVGMVVLDEVHYLGDPWRGSVWEEAIINCPRHIQILAMSATVQNPEALGGWIGDVHGACETVKTQFRPVPLQWGFAHKAPKRGALLENLLMEPVSSAAAAAGGGKQQQQQQGKRGSSSNGKDASSSSSRGGSGSSLAAGGSGMGLSLNPGLKLDLWIHQELKHMAAQEAQAARDFGTSLQQQGMGGDFGDMWGLPPEDVGRSPRSPQQIWSSLSARDKRDLTRKVMARRTPTQAQVIRVLQQRNMLPAIWFIMSRRDCDLSAIAAASDLELVSPEEAAQLNDELQQLFDDSPEGVRDKLVPAFLRGISSHHAGCLPAWKSLVERCFQKGLLKLVFATGTLAAGINMPARTTVISSLARRTDEGIQLLPHNELLQMAGRAGRRGYDTQGHCVVVQGRFEGAEAAHSIISAGPEPLKSQFTTSYSLVLNLLSAYSLDEAREFLSKTFGTYEIKQYNRGKRAEAEQLMQAAAALTAAAAAPKADENSNAQQAALAAVKREKSALMYLYKKALTDHARLAATLLAQPPAAAAAAAAQPDPHAAFAAAAAASAGDGDLQQQAPQLQLQLPQLVLLNLVKNPVDSKQQPEYLPALAVQQIDSLPLSPGPSFLDTPKAPFLLCLGADNQPLAVSVQHVVGVNSDPQMLDTLLASNAEQLQRLDTLLTKHLASKRVWTVLRKMPSCQVTFGSTLTAPLALSLNVPVEQFSTFGVSAGMAAKIEQQQAAVAAAKKKLAALQQADADASAASAAAGSGSSSGGESDGGGDGSAGAAAVSEGVLRMLMKLKGRDRLQAARRLAKRAKKLLAEAQDEDQMNTWTSFMDVLSILVELGAMEQDTMRILPLGLVARGINCNNELWMAAAMTHPDVMALTPPQLAAFVGALQCTDLLKRPMSIWSSFQVSDAVVRVIEELEPSRQAIFEAQTAFGQTRWNEHLAVDLRLAGLVEAWAAGASWQEVMADTSLDDGDMARLLARTADMLKQLTFLEEQLPYLIPAAREALRGMDRKPISDLVA